MLLLAADMQIPYGIFESAQKRSHFCTVPLGDKAVLPVDSTAISSVLGHHLWSLQPLTVVLLVADTATVILSHIASC